MDISYTLILVVESYQKTHYQFFIYLSVICGRAAKMRIFYRAKPHVQKQLRQNRNKTKIYNLK
jgi:hypothetical protein